MRPNIEVMCIVKFQYATSAMLALPYDHFLVSLLFMDVPITVIVPSILLNSFLNVLFNFIYINTVERRLSERQLYESLIIRTSSQDADSAKYGRQPTEENY